MCIFRAEAVETVSVRRFSGLLDEDANNFDNWVLEHEDPSYLGPVEVRLGFFGQFHGGEGVIVECARWSSILYE